MDLGQHDDFTQVTSLRRICPAEEAKETNGLSFWCLKLAPVLFHSMLLSNFFFSSNLSTVADGHKVGLKKKLESSKKFLLPYFFQSWGPKVSTQSMAGSEDRCGTPNSKVWRSVPSIEVYTKAFSLDSSFLNGALQSNNQL